MQLLKKLGATAVVLVVVFGLGYNSGRSALPDKSVEVAGESSEKLKADEDLKESVKASSEEAEKSVAKKKKYYPSGVLKSEEDLVKESSKKADEETIRNLRKSLEAEFAAKYSSKIVENSDPSNLVSGWIVLPFRDFFKFAPVGWGVSYQYRWIPNTYVGAGYEKRDIRGQIDHEGKIIGSYLF